MIAQLESRRIQPTFDLAAFRALLKTYEGFQFHVRRPPDDWQSYAFETKLERRYVLNQVRSLGLPYDVYSSSRFHMIDIYVG